VIQSYRKKLYEKYRKDVDMKKRYLTIVATVMTFVTVITGCGLQGDDTQKATEYINDETESSDASTAMSAVDFASESGSTIVVDGLMEPVLEEASASASTSIIETPAAATVATTEEVNESDKTVMVFMGDSQFANGRSEGTDIPHLIGERVPDSVVYNLGIGGTTGAIEMTTSDVSPENLVSTSFLGMTYALSGQADRNNVLSEYPEILETMNKVDPKEVDYYFLSYGTNDFFLGLPLDHTQYDGDPMHCFYDAMCTGIDKLKELSPDATIILLTPFYGVYYDSDNNLIGDTYVVSNYFDTLANYARKSKNVAEDENIESFDTMFGTHCDLYIDTADQYLIDGVHLTLTGRQIFARLLAHLPNYMEKNEPSVYYDTDYIKISEFNPDEYYKYRDDMLKEYYPDYYEKLINGEYKLAKPDEE